MTSKFPSWTTLKALNYIASEIRVQCEFGSRRSALMLHVSSLALWQVYRRA